MRELFGELSGSGARLARLIAAAISVSDARSVFVTYVCVKTKTLQPQERKDAQWQNVGEPFNDVLVTDTRRVALPDSDAVLWWGRTANPPSGEVAAALTRNAPRSGCSCR